MKKLTALLLSLTLPCGAAMALDEESEPTVIEPVENGVAVPFAEHNFQITLSADWDVIALSEEDTANGYLFACKTPDSALPRSTPTEP